MKSLSEAVIKSKEENRLVSIDDAVVDLPGWDSFHKVFKKAMNSESLQSYTFGTLGIDKPHLILNDFDSLCDIAVGMHEGLFASSLAIIHFLNATDNEIPQEASEFYQEFRDNCPEHVPENFESLMIPTRHADPIDGIYIQCLGNTFWTAYYDDHVEKFALKPGDIMVIPKGVEHSVESLTPRAGLSIAMADD